MDNSVLAALITAAASVIVAFISSFTTLLKSGKLSDSRWQWIKPFGYYIAFALVISGAVAVYYLQSDGTAARLAKDVPTLPDYTKRIYANVGLGFVHPNNWELEDYAFRFGGGSDLRLVASRDENGHYETQGILISIVNIAKHHWNEPESEFLHFEDQLKVDCVPFGWTRGTGSFANGRHATLFTCSRELRSKGRRDEQVYWFQLTRCVRLKIRSWSTLSGKARASFEQELPLFLRNLRLDSRKIDSLENERETRCDPR
jgi:hypothetical protein